MDDTNYNMSMADSRRLFMGAPKKCPESGKVCYDKKGALTAKNARYRQDHVELWVYHCPDCNMWHLTHSV